MAPFQRSGNDVSFEWLMFQVILSSSTNSKGCGQQAKESHAALFIGYIYSAISTMKECFLLWFRLKAWRMWILNMPDLENYALTYLDTQLIYFCKKHFTRLLLMSEPVAQPYVHWEDISLREVLFQHTKWIKIIRHARRPLWNLIYNIRRVYFSMYPSSNYCIF